MVALGVCAQDLPELERRIQGGEVHDEVELALALQQPGHQDLRRSEALLRAAAGTGNAEAERCLGRFLHLVDGAPKDYPEARRWYEKAAAQGDLWAINNLGVMRHQGLLRGYLVLPTGVTDALPFYRRAAEGGFPMAQYNLAYCYYEGRGLDRNYSEAERWFLRSAEGGYTEAMIQLSYMYSKADGVRADGRKAIAWARRAADLGSADGFYNLAWCYDGGVREANDPAAAEKYYLEAARLGHADAMHNVGFLYGEGKLGAPDYQKARYWYEQAIARGETTSLLNLGTLYFEGLGVAKDWKRGADYVFWGAYAGDPGAQGRLGYMYYCGEGVPKDWVNGLAWSILAAEGGDHNGAKNVHEGSIRMGFADRARAHFRVIGIRKEMNRRTLVKRIKASFSRDGIAEEG
ncbi:MAG TPA: hypothetical protein VJ463_02310 [Geothrix sp.]|nr:hypothetical protein [Geothrix sp.]